MKTLLRFDLKSMSLAQIFAAGMVLLLLALAVIWLTLATEVNHLSATSSRLNEEVPQLTQSIATITKFQADHVGVSKIAVPTTLNVSTILQQSHRLVTRYGVRLMGLSVQPSADPSPSPSVANAFAKLSGASNLHAYPVNVTVDGSKAKVMSYIQGLTQGPDFATVMSVSFSLGNASDVQAVITYEVYAENN